MAIGPGVELCRKSQQGVAGFGQRRIGSFSVSQQSGRFFMTQTPEIIVTDINGTLITAGCRVRVHQDDQIRDATVVEVFPGSPTVNSDGHWVDVSFDEDNGLVDGIMSYICEVIQ